MKYLLFGTGDYYQRYKKWFKKDEVVALLDNSTEKQHKVIDGIEVVSPMEGIKLEFDKIVILSFYVKSMKEQLIQLNVPHDKIYHFFELYKLNLNQKSEYLMCCYGKTQQEIIRERSDSILLLSTDLELQSGPVTVLIRMAKILKKNGMNVVFGSMMDGPQKEKLLCDNIPVVIDANLQIDTMKNIEWVHGFKHIVCNTIGFCVFMSERGESTPLTWWLHDSDFFYDGIERKLLKETDFEDVQVVSVGKIPRQAFNRIVPDVKIDNLLYGINKSIDPFFVNFMVMGYIEKRKGQDILIEAIRLLDADARSKARFYFVGKDSSEMAKQIKEQVKNIPEVIITGLISEQEKKCLINKIDVLICPSREDPMPAVVVEAMMNRIPSIVSDSTGISEFISDGVNGLLFRNGNALLLSQKITWCINNFSKLPKIGKRAEEIYSKYFSMEAFEKNILDLLQS